ncbi:MAG: thermonuclease family protein [Candidatus Methylomirabilia bacterium]
MLLLVAVFACSRGGGCSGPKRPIEDGNRAVAGIAGAPAASPSPGMGSAPETLPLPRQRRVEAEGTVVRVRDGDSIVVRRDGVGVEVRLDGVDCPELAQAFGRKAKKFTSGLVFGKTVRLSGKGRDRYDRELAEVFLPDGRSLNRELVSAGFAWWYRTYSTDRSLEALERTARTSSRGLWADAHPVPPWDFRAGNQRRPGGGR